MYSLHQDCYKRSLKQSLDESSHEETFADAQGNEEHSRTMALGESSVIVNLQIRTK